VKAGLYEGKKDGRKKEEKKGCMKEGRKDYMRKEGRKDCIKACGGPQFIRCLSCYVYVCMHVYVCVYIIYIYMYIYIYINIYICLTCLRSLLNASACTEATAPPRKKTRKE
jgi:hypothetical protein